MRKKIIWILLGVMAVIIRIGLAGRPEWIERFYSRGLFQGIRWIIDYLFAWLPIPLIYVFFFLLILIIGRRIRRTIRAERPLKEKIMAGALSILAFISGVVFFFLFLWGYNYGRQSIETQLALEVQPLSLTELREELQVQSKVIIDLRKRIPGAGPRSLTADFYPPKMEAHLRGNLEAWLQQHGFPTAGRVRARQLWPKGVFLRFSSSGLYFPLTGEGHVDAGVHPLQRPYVMTHEMGHGYGFGDEGTCNFLAYLGCSRSDDPFIAYVGHLGYWRTLAVNYLRYEPEKYRTMRDGLPVGIRADLDGINESLQKYPDIMPRLRYHAYDAYLKTQGIEDGMLNYNRVVMLVRAWRNARSM